MSALVGSLLELARTEAKGVAKKEPVELAALVREVFAPLALPLEQKHLQLQLELEEVSLSGDRARLEEAVENLASNALLPCRFRRNRTGLFGKVGPSRPPHRVQRRAQHPVRGPIPALGALLPRRSLPQPGQRRHRPGIGHRLENRGGPRRPVLAENRPVGVAFVLELPI